MIYKSVYLYCKWIFNVFQYL